MTCDIFIRTYHKDIPWLQHLLKSIQAYASGFRNIIIAVPASSAQLVRDGLNLNTSTFATVYTVPDYENDYLGQQVTKLHADLFCRSEYILFIDSDCVFTTKTMPENYVDQNGRPHLLRTPYAAISQDAQRWKGITEKALGFECPYETMRRMPLVYRKYDLVLFREWFKENRGKLLEKYILEQPGNDFSEFNAIGSWLEKFHSVRYNIVDTHEAHTEVKSIKRGKGVQEKEETTYIDLPTPPSNVKQFWSWGGITPEILAEMAKLSV